MENMRNLPQPAKNMKTYEQGARDAPGPGCWLAHGLLALLLEMLLPSFPCRGLQNHMSKNNQNMLNHSQLAKHMKNIWSELELICILRHI